MVQLNPRSTELSFRWSTGPGEHPLSGFGSTDYGLGDYMLLRDYMRGEALLGERFTE
jgi:hypothetical protein